MPPKRQKSELNASSLQESAVTSPFLNLDIIGIVFELLDGRVVGRFGLCNRLIKSRSLAVFSNKCKSEKFIADPSVFKKLYSSSWERLYFDRREVKKAWHKYLLGTGFNPEVDVRGEDNFGEEFDLDLCGQVIANLDKGRRLVLENFFFWCTGDAQKRCREFYKAQNAADGDEEAKESEEDEEAEEEADPNYIPYKTYNCDFSMLKWLKQEDVAEIIMAPLVVEDSLNACSCKDTLQTRFHMGEFHDEDCCQNLDGCYSFILRLWSGEYIRIMALSTNPRDYNGAAVWRSFNFEELITKVDLDGPYVR